MAEVVRNEGWPDIPNTQLAAKLQGTSPLLEWFDSRISQQKVSFRASPEGCQDKGLVHWPAGKKSMAVRRPISISPASGRVRLDAACIICQKKSDLSLSYRCLSQKVQAAVLLSSYDALRQNSSLR